MNLARRANFPGNTVARSLEQSRKRAGKLGLVLWLVCAAPVVTFAERVEKGDKTDKTEKSAQASTSSPLPVASNEDAWPEVQEFMQAHSRRKWDAYEKLNADNKRNLRGQLISRYNELKRVVNKDIYALEVQRVEIEDEIFGALSDLKRARPGEKERIRRDELRPAVSKLIRNRMQERQVRITNLQNQLNRIQEEAKKDAALEANPTQLNALITRRAAEIERHELGTGPGPRPNRTRPPGAGTGPTTAPTSRPSSPVPVRGGNDDSDE